MEVGELSIFLLILNVQLIKYEWLEFANVWAMWEVPNPSECLVETSEEGLK